MTALLFAAFGLLGLYGALSTRGLTQVLYVVGAFICFVVAVDLLFDAIVERLP